MGQRWQHDDRQHEGDREGKGLGVGEGREQLPLGAREGEDRNEAEDRREDRGHHGAGDLAGAAANDLGVAGALTGL